MTYRSEVYGAFAPFSNTMSFYWFEKAGIQNIIKGREVTCGGGLWVGIIIFLLGQVQRSKKWRVCGLMKFATAVARLVCPDLLG